MSNYLETCSDEEYFRAQFFNVYMHLDHLHAIVRALSTSITILVDACNALEDGEVFTAVQRAHLRLALREARESMQMAQDMA